MERKTIEADLKQFLIREVLEGDAEGLASDTPLLELGLIDSLSMMSLLAFIDAELGIRVPDDAVRPENFASLAAISGFLVRLPPAQPPPTVDQRKSR